MRQYLRESEIGKLDVTLLLYEYILRFEAESIPKLLSVNDVLLVEGLQR